MQRKTRMHVWLCSITSLAACGDAQPSPPDANAPPPPPPGYSVALGASSSLGDYLTDSAGKTLYYFANDRPATPTTPAVSTCGAGCIAAWPVFHATADDVGTGIDRADLGELTRSDGTKQTTYKGWPLHYFANDAIAGDVTGDDSGHLWFVLRAPFYSALIMSSASAGHYLADAKGRTLYASTADVAGTADQAPTSNCLGACATAWPPFVVDGAVLPTGVDPSLTTFTRSDGATQVAWRGRPLYFFHGDAAPGDTKGNAVSTFTVLDPSTH